MAIDTGIKPKHSTASKTVLVILIAGLILLVSYGISKYDPQEAKYTDKMERLLGLINELEIEYDLLYQQCIHDTKSYTQGNWKQDSCYLADTKAQKQFDYIITWMKYATLRG